MTEFNDDQLMDTEAEDTEIEEEVNDEFEVVVPKEDIIVMDPQPEPTFDAHMLSFTSFYIKMFKTNNLEVMEEYNSDSLMMELNKYIMHNVHFARKALTSKLLATHLTKIETLLANIDAKSDEDTKNFTSFQQWDAWYDNMRAEGRIALS